MEACVAIEALALQATGTESRKVHVSHTDTGPLIPAVRPSVHYGILILFSIASWSGVVFLSFVLYSSFTWILSPCFPSEAVGSSANRDASSPANMSARDKWLFSAWGSHSYSTGGLSAQYLIALFLPSASSHVSSQSPGSRTGRHHLWLHVALIVVFLKSLCPLDRRSNRSCTLHLCIFACLL